MNRRGERARGRQLARWGPACAAFLLAVATRGVAPTLKASTAGLVSGPALCYRIR